MIFSKTINMVVSWKDIKQDDKRASLSLVLGLVLEICVCVFA